MRNFVELGIFYKNIYGQKKELFILHKNSFLCVQLIDVSYIKTIDMNQISAFKLWKLNWVIYFLALLSWEKNNNKTAFIHSKERALIQNQKYSTFNLWANHMDQIIICQIINQTMKKKKSTLSDSVSFPISEITKSY